MCDYCRKFTQSVQKIREGQDVNIGYEGEDFIDFFNNLIIHLDGCYNGNQSIEASLPIKYCPWCGARLDNRVLKYANQDILQDVLMPATQHEQESFKPVRDSECGRFWLCGNCGCCVGFEDNDSSDPNEFDNYCRKCGKEVKWND